MRPADVRARLAALGIRASKALGQHFLIDERVAHRQVEYAGIEQGDVVLEVGPGLGVLTERIADRAAKVVAVERDRRLARALREREGRVEVLVGDAVRIPLPRFDRVVSNLPYRISSPITFRLLGLPFERAVLMYQREFADRLVAKPGTRDYSRLSVKAYVRARAEVVETVPRSAFWPPPKVEGAVVVLEPRPFPFDVTDEDVFDAVVDAAFAHRRKAIENSLRLGWRRLGADPGSVEAILDGLPHRGRRPEELTPEEFGELSDAIARRAS